MASKRTWKEKLYDSKDLPKTVPMPERMRKQHGEGLLLVPAPIQVDAVMRSVPFGKLITINGIRARLAAANDAQATCPMTTGIFAWIAANAADECLTEAVTDEMTPWWRTLKADGELNPKYPGGVEAQRTLLESEGHMVLQKGECWLVLDYESVLV
jgi:hypothetical protein